MVKKTFYVTTAIDYVNAEPHIGHAYQKIVADALARWSRLQGKDTFFLTGTDEHGKKIAKSAEAAGKSPKEFCDLMAKKFEDAWTALDVAPDRFIRTTDKDHEEVVKKIIEKVNKNGDIYKGHYEGLYCTDCETYYTEKDCPDNLCPIHKKPLEVIKEESYFFKMSKYQGFLLDHYKKHPEFIQPKERRNEIINRVKEGLQDLSITRTSFNWGIPFPLDKKHVIYVWFDALINYYSAINNKKNQKYWPADYHLLGKDNGWFHAVIWPAMLKSAGIELPKTVFIHGFLKFNGQKISKSLGNAISPTILVEKYGKDSIRYFVLRQFPFAAGEDGDFSEQALIDRHNNELADKLGNLVSRVSTLAEKFGIEKSKKSPLASKNLQKAVEKHFEKLEFDKALNEIFTFIDQCNEYVQKSKPWESGDKEVLYNLVQAIRDASILLSPFIPETAEKIAKTFNFEINYKSLSKPLKIAKIKKSEILFRKIDTMAKQVNKLPIASPKMPVVPKNDSSKIELKVGKIINAEDHPNAEKLLVLTVDFAEGKPRTIVAGLRKYYKKEELQERKAIFVTNLEPANLRGIESNGMILAASNEDHSSVVFLQPKEDIKEGSKIEFKNG
ncbi:MAG: methionine--tRNA ligase [Candidatus Nanoarchaeia archaeon]|nr:methionine--tRNA ligase [Candidatus Nanoarchaeia archaeon]